MTRQRDASDSTLIMCLKLAYTFLWNPSFSYRSAPNSPRFIASSMGLDVAENRCWRSAATVANQTTTTSKPANQQLNVRHERTEFAKAVGEAHLLQVEENDAVRCREATVGTSTPVHSKPILCRGEGHAAESVVSVAPPPSVSSKDTVSRKCSHTRAPHGERRNTRIQNIQHIPNHRIPYDVPSPRTQAQTQSEKVVLTHNGHTRWTFPPLGYFRCAVSPPSG